MFDDFTTIEKIYIKRFNIRINNLTLKDRMDITEIAYIWASEMSEECGFDVLKNKDKFVKWLRERVELK